MNQLTRLKAMTLVPPPNNDNAPPLPPTESPAPPVTSVPSIDMPYVPEKWSRGPDVRDIVGAVYMIPPSSDNWLTEVSDLMGVADDTHTGPLPIYGLSL